MTGDLRREQTTLEARVEELKAFEREYRTRLRSYLEGQLHDLDNLGEVAPGPRTAAPSERRPGAEPDAGRRAVLGAHPVGGAAGSGPDTLGRPRPAPAPAPAPAPTPSLAPPPPPAPQPAGAPSQGGQPPRPGATPFGPPSPPPARADEPPSGPPAQP